MNITLTIVVAAIVILITALVVITIFGGSMGNVASLTEAKSMCDATCKSSCRATGSPPITWNIPNIKDPDTGGMTDCNTLSGKCDCGSTAPASNTNNNNNLA